MVFFFLFGLLCSYHTVLQTGGSVSSQSRVSRVVVLLGRQARSCVPVKPLRMLLSSNNRFIQFSLVRVCTNDQEEAMDR
jgi:hypothetical protein